MSDLENQIPDPSNPNRLEEYAGLLTDVSRLIGEIEADQKASHFDDTFSFEHLWEFDIEVPQIVSEHIPDLDLIKVTLTKDGPKETMSKILPSLVSLSVEFASKTKMVIASRFADETEEPDSLIDLIDRDAIMKLKHLHSEIDEDFEKRITPIERISKEEFNKFIMSLLYPDKERGYKMFKGADLFAPRAYENLIDSFFLTTLGNLSRKEYAFETNDIHFSFSKHDGQPTSFTFIYPEKYFGQPITAKSDLETDFQLKFTTHELTEQNPFSPGLMPRQSPYYPSTEEIAYLRSIIETEIMAVAPVEVGYAEDTPSSEPDPETIFEETKGRALFSKNHVENVLKQLGLDSPDSGAT